MDLIWLIPLLPGLGALVNGVVGVRYFSKRTAGLVACATMAAALLLSLYAFWQLLGLPGRGPRAHGPRGVVDFVDPARSWRTARSGASPSRGASGSTRSPG